ncbi:MAG: hypothetical protein ABIJ21_08910 [Nanoarchaeota archaeon]
MAVWEDIPYKTFLQHFIERGIQDGYRNLEVMREKYIICGDQVPLEDLRRQAQAMVDEHILTLRKDGSYGVVNASSV